MKEPTSSAYADASIALCKAIGVADHAGCKHTARGMTVNCIVQSCKLAGHRCRGTREGVDSMGVRHTDDFITKSSTEQGGIDQDHRDYVSAHLSLVSGSHKHLPY